MDYVKESYELAKKRYAQYGIDTDAVLEQLKSIAISMHCWQGDDVIGFENPDGELTGGIQTTGNYPGKARCAEELMADFEKTLSLVPGTKRINLHAIYAISDTPVARDEIEPKHFDAWLDYAKKHNVKLDFNPTLFSHPMQADGLTLSHPNKEVRDFWIRHCRASRKIAAYIGEKQGSPCLCNLWIPDGLKNAPADRLTPRLRLKDSLDQIYADKYDSAYIIDAVESKVFGIGVESYTVGSSEFYLSYAATHGINALLDNGHFHPTEQVADKIPSLLAFFDKVALHVTKPVRWDSDHVLLLEDEVKDIAIEIIRNHAEERVLIGLDYFDASINRVGAWAVGARNMQKALLNAALMPHDQLKALQDAGNFSRLMATQEELKTMPLGDVWEEYLKREGVKGFDWFDDVEAYEREVTSKRS
jgi:L-rhamnose isomerase